MPHDDLTIVYEDRSLLLCVKPVGVLSEDSENGASMPHLLRQHYAAAHQPDYIATVHRLDKVTGGLMLFSRQRAVTGRLIAAVAEHRVEKEYLAVLRGHPPEKEGELIDGKEQELCGQADAQGCAGGKAVLPHAGRDR